jgi:L-alanine-DL-glutamate epimerase-like enolase superfamily enzyme
VALYEQVSGLDLEVEELATERRSLSVSSEFERVTTTVVLRGAGAEGRGEDVTYVAEEHDDFPLPEPTARTTLDGFSDAVEPLGLADYRRWAFESAALDLALRQAGLSLGEALGLEYRPVRFVVSTRLEARPWLDLYPQLELKLDPTSNWSREHMQAIAATGRVRILDLKGQYRGTPVDQPADPDLYRAVAEIFPDAVIEDPALTDGTLAALAGAEDRISWDAPIHSVADIEALPWEPRWLNVKPSRFGSVRRLLDAIDYAREHGIRLYGGGQFELGVGREHIQALASLFYADAPNDVAPGVYNEGGPRPGLPQSPLPARAGIGL